MSSSNINTKRKPVSGILTGFIFMLFATIFFITIYSSYILSIDNLFTKLIIVGTVLFIFFGIGSFMPILRDSGFRYYMTVRKNRIAKIEKAKKKNKELKYPGTWQNFIFKIFRDGSVAEECAYYFRKLKEGEPSFNFMEECKNIQEVVDKHRELSSKITDDYPKIGIGKTYHDCEKFQCFDTCFLFISILTVIFFPLNLIFNYLYDYNFSIILPFIYGVLFFSAHKLCKQKSKEMANRYLIDINTGWKKINEEKENEMNKSADISVNTIKVDGDGNTIIITNINTSVAEIKEKLNSAGISEKAIKEIEPQISEIAAECKKDKPDEGKLHGIFSTLKEKGGSDLIKAFKFLTKTTAGAVIQNIIDKLLGN